MPDIADRQKREESLELLLRRAFGRTREAILAALGSPPDVANIPESVWQQLQQEVEDDTRDTIALIMLLGIRRAGESIGGGWKPSSDRAGELAGDYASRRARELSTTLADTYRDRLRTAVDEARARIDGGESPTAAERDLARRAREIGEEQAKAGGVTETTAANSAGELEWRDEYEQASGLTLAAYWQTEADGKVCPICRPLHEQPESAWENDFPAGPPAHPNCRCYLEFEPG